ncbi:RICIN domain-containing protein [Streptomyces sp. NPDC001339]|uniref:RICIN domain-containing protein n=1 Tax=Streptomyces sp. NPDC001339 TaxID=3364563 RepID=UPI0036A0B17D
MSRPIRAALAIAASVTALVGATATATAHADQATLRAAAAPQFTKLQLAKSEKCLTIAKGSFRNGANAEQQTCADGLDNQVFEMIPTGSATFELRAKHSGKCLEVSGSSKEIRANVQQWWCVDTPAQRWKVVLVDTAKELYQLSPTHALDRCLDISGGSVKDGANANQWYCNGSDAQRWRLLPVQA